MKVLAGRLIFVDQARYADQSASYAIERSLTYSQLCMPVRFRYTPAFRLNQYNYLILLYILLRGGIELHCKHLKLLHRKFSNNIDTPRDTPCQV